MEMNWMSEQGSIDADRTNYKIKKHGVFSGNWTLELKGQEFAEAQKSTAMRRTFEISSPMGDLTLIPESILNRCFRLECSGEVIARIKPAHPFTRRSEIEIQGVDFDFPTICFAYWLVLITWRRSNKNSSSGSG